MPKATPWWKKPAFQSAAALLVIGGAFAVVPPVVTELVKSPAPIVCSIEYDRYGELEKKYPRADIRQDADDEVEKQCQINDFLDTNP